MPFGLRRPRFGCLGGGEHVFDEDAVARSGITDEDVGNGADEFSVLEDGRAAQ